MWQMYRVRDEEMQVAHLSQPFAHEEGSLTAYPDHPPKLQVVLSSRVPRIPELMMSLTTKKKKKSSRDRNRYSF